MAVRLHVVLGVVAALLAGPSWGTVFPCDEVGLDAAIATADGGDPGPHTFKCTATSPPVVVSGEKRLSSEMTLDGEGRLVLEWGDGFGFRMIVVGAGGPVVLRRMQLRGYGVLNLENLTLDRVVISDVPSGGSAAVWSFNRTPFRPATLTMIHSAVVGQFDGIYAGVEIGNGDAAIRNSAIIGNTGSFSAGIIIPITTMAPSAAMGTILIENTTVSGNVSHSGWGGIQNHSCVMFTIRNSILADNRGRNEVGLLHRPTVSNRMGLGACSDEFTSETIVENSIIEGACDLSDPLASMGGNIESPGDTCQLTHATDEVGAAVQSG